MNLNGFVIVLFAKGKCVRTGQEIISSLYSGEGDGRKKQDFFKLAGKTSIVDAS